MSRHNRERRWWKCATCANPMRVPDDNPRALDPDARHVCGRCKTFHKLVGGGLVRLTPAEMFELYVKYPVAMERIERAPVVRVPPGEERGPTEVWADE